MIDADMMIVTALDNLVQVEDHYSTAHYIPPKDSILGGTQDLHFIEGGLDSKGHIDVFFYRKLVTGDEFDEEISPNGLLEISWAHKNFANGIERHSDDDTGAAEIVFADREEFLHFKRFGIDQFTKAHATHMSVSWGISMTVAVIAARYFKWTSWWIYVHMVLASQVVISTIVSSATQFHYDQIFSSTMHDLQLFSSRLGFFIVSLCAGQGLFGFLLLYVRWSGQNYQTVSFITRAHKVVGWVLVFLGYSSIHLGDTFIGPEIGFYYFMMLILVSFELFSNLQMYYPRFRFYVRKISIMSHEEAFDLIKKGRLLMFADELIIDIQHFQYTHPGGKFMISEAVGEDTGKYLTGCSSYGGPFQPYSHSEAAFNMLKYLAIGRVPYPKGYLQSKAVNLNQDSMEFLIFKQEMIAKNIWILTLKSEDFYMADLPMPEWLGKHFKIVHKTSRFRKVRRYYSSLFTDLAVWGRELGIEFPGEKECPGAVQIIYKAYEGGEMTQYLQGLPKGSPIEVQGPLGPGLMLSTLKGNYLAFAGGTGLIPFLDLLHLVWQSRSTLTDFSFTLYVFFRNDQEGFCIDLLKKVQEHLSSFFFLRLIMTQTRKSFILEKEIELMTQDNFNKIWLCGPSALNRRIYSSLDQNGFDKNKIILM